MSELYKTIEDYLKVNNGQFPGDCYWEQRFKSAYEKDKEKYEQDSTHKRDN